MTLPSSGSLSYNSIRAEFGSPSTNVYLSLYYRRGPYCYNLPQNSSITTGSSSTISVANFYGAEGPARYAAGTGGTYNTGGKLPAVYYGTGSAASLPAMSDTSINIGGTQRTIVSFYYFTGILNGVNIGLPQGHFSGMNARTFRVYYDSNFSNFYSGTTSPSSAPGFQGTSYVSWQDSGPPASSFPAGTSLNSGQRNLYRGF